MSNQGSIIAIAAGPAVVLLGLAAFMVFVRCFDPSTHFRRRRISASPMMLASMRRRGSRPERALRPAIKAERRSIDTPIRTLRDRALNPGTPPTLDVAPAADLAGRDLLEHFQIARGMPREPLSC